MSLKGMVENIVGTDNVRELEGGGVLVEPETIDEIRNIIKVAAEKGYKIFPRGSGTDVEGKINSDIVLSTLKLRKILRVDETNMLIEVEAGTIVSDLISALVKADLFLPCSPTSAGFSTIGGSIATNAVGLRALKHRFMGGYVVGIEVVLPDGETAALGYRDLGRMACGIEKLFVGTRGAFGIISKVCLKVVRKPLFIRTLVIAFEDILSAGRVALNIVSTGIMPFSLELLDSNSLDIVGGSFDFPRGSGAILIVETEGFPDAAIMDAKRIMKMGEDGGALYLKVLENLEEWHHIWKLRRGIFRSVVYSQTPFLFENVVVPRSSLISLCEGIIGILRKTGAKSTVFGHIGDGNLHICFLEGSAEQISQASKELHALVKRLNGTVLRRRGRLIGRATLLQDDDRAQIMRRLKDALDPKGVISSEPVFML
ncbi:MAG: FAD-binding oxidoreductase [Synergistetes bacterium]|nr:FAD-binding oxidoreductase [Synergistota bacterium]